MDPFYPHLKWIDEEKKSTAATLQTWSNIHSGTNHLPGLKLMFEELKKAFSSLNGILEEITVPNQEVLSETGELSEMQIGKMLFIKKRPTAPIQILFSGHMDIAYPAHLPLTSSEWLHDDILKGRGTADMKSGLLVMLLALKALEKSPLCTKIGWEVLINADEEIGSPGSTKILLEAAKRHQIGLIFEPALPNGNLVSSRKGSVNYSVVIKGKSAHAGREFDKGCNAITSAARFAINAESLTDFKKGLTVNIGYIKGGNLVNIVPDHAVCGLNIRAETLDDFKRVKEKILKIAEQENSREGIMLILHQNSERVPKIFDLPTQKLFESLNHCGLPLGLNLEWKNSGGVCDGNTLSSAGLPTIDTLGGIGGNLHTAEEFVSISSILIKAKLVARFLMQIASGEIIL